MKYNLHFGHKDILNHAYHPCCMIIIFKFCVTNDYFAGDGINEILPNCNGQVIGQNIISSTKMN